MRKREREVTDEAQILEILDKCKVLYLGLSDEDQPYVVPMNYGYVMEEGKLTFYLHGATEGYKYELLRKNPKVSVAMACDMEPFEGKVACQYGMAYASLLGKGTAEVLTDVNEKQQALSALMKTQTGREFAFDEKMVSIVNVIRITMTEYSAKRRPLPKMF